MSEARGSARARLRAGRPRRLGRRRLRPLPAAAAIRSTRSFCDVSATVSCTQVYQSRFSTRRGHSGRDLRRDLVRRARRCCRSAAWSRGRRSARASRAICSRARRSRSPWFCISATRRSCPEGVLSVCLLTYAAVIGHLHRVRRGHFVPDDDIASPCIARTCACSSAARWRLPWPCCSSAGAASTLAFFPREGAAPSAGAPRAGADRGSAQRARAVHGDRRRGCRSSSRATARRCWSSSSTTFSVRPAASRTRLQADPRQVRSAGSPARCSWC